MPLTEQQRSAVAKIRAAFRISPFKLGTAESVEQRARRPDPGCLPTDVAVRVEIAPSSLQPHLLLNSYSGALKTPERVPVYFYTLQSDRAKPDVADTYAIFHVHGGGYVSGHPANEPVVNFVTHLLRAVASRSGDPSKFVVIAPSYRLSTVPENAFPAALQDVVTAYDYVISKGYKASNIVLAGDSVGGNHATVLTHLILLANQAPPRGIVAVAPAAIQFLHQMSEHAMAHADTDILDVALCEQLARLYIGDSGAAPTDPLISGTSIPFTASWPRMLILVGSGDITIDGSRMLETKLSGLHLPVELVEYDERPHAWWNMPHVFGDDILDAAGRIARFVLDSESAHEE